MIIKFTLIVLVIFTAGSAALAQNTNSSQTVRPRTTVSPSTTSKTSDSQKSTDVQQPTTTKATPQRT